MEDLLFLKTISHFWEAFGFSHHRASPVSTIAEADQLVRIPRCTTDSLWCGWSRRLRCNSVASHFLKLNRSTLGVTEIPTPHSAGSL